MRLAPTTIFGVPWNLRWLPRPRNGKPRYKLFVNNSSGKRRPHAVIRRESAWWRVSVQAFSGRIAEWSMCPTLREAKEWALDVLTTGRKLIELPRLLYRQDGTVLVIDDREPAKMTYQRIKPWGLIDREDMRIGAEEVIIDTKVFGFSAVMPEIGVYVDVRQRASAEPGLERVMEEACRTRLEVMRLDYERQRMRHVLRFR